MEGEKYQPTPEEIQKAEEMMTEEQKMQSESRAEGFVLGQQKESPEAPKQQIDTNEIKRQKSKEQSFQILNHLLEVSRQTEERLSRRISTEDLNGLYGPIIRNSILEEAGWSDWKIENIRGKKNWRGIVGHPKKVDSLIASSHQLGDIQYENLAKIRDIREVDKEIWNTSEVKNDDERILFTVNPETDILTDEDWETILRAGGLKVLGIDKDKTIAQALDGAEQSGEYIFPGVELSVFLWKKFFQRDLTQGGPARYDDSALAVYQGRESKPKVSEEDKEIFQSIIGTGNSVVFPGTLIFDDYKGSTEGCVLAVGGAFDNRWLGDKRLIDMSTHPTSLSNDQIKIVLIKKSAIPEEIKEKINMISKVIE